MKRRGGSKTPYKSHKSHKSHASSLPSNRGSRSKLFSLNSFFSKTPAQNENDKRHMIDLKETNSVLKRRLVAIHRELKKPEPNSVYYYDENFPNEQMIRYQEDVDERAKLRKIYDLIKIRIQLNNKKIERLKR